MMVSVGASGLAHVGIFAALASMGAGKAPGDGAEWAASTVLDLSLSGASPVALAPTPEIPQLPEPTKPPEQPKPEEARPEPDEPRIKLGNPDSPVSTATAWATTGAPSEHNAAKGAEDQAALAITPGGGAGGVSPEQGQAAPEATIPPAPNAEGAAAPTPPAPPTSSPQSEPKPASDSGQPQSTPPSDAKDDASRERVEGAPSPVETPLLRMPGEGSDRETREAIAPPSVAGDPSIWSTRERTPMNPEAKEGDKAQDEADQAPAPTPEARPERRQENPGVEAAIPAVQATEARKSPASVSPGKAGDKGQASDREAEAASKDPIVDVEIREGRPVSAKGLEILPSRARFAVVTQLTVRPRNPRVWIKFGRDGKVVDADFETGFDAGHPDVNEPIRQSLFRWRARGEELAKLSPTDKKAGVTVRFRIVLSRE